MLYNKLSSTYGIILYTSEGRGSTRTTRAAVPRCVRQRRAPPRGRQRRAAPRGVALPGRRRARAAAPQGEPGCEGRAPAARLCRLQRLASAAARARPFGAAVEMAAQEDSAARGQEELGTRRGLRCHGARARARARGRVLLRPRGRVHAPRGVSHGFAAHACALTHTRARA